MIVLVLHINHGWCNRRDSGHLLCVGNGTCISSMTDLIPIIIQPKWDLTTKEILLIFQTEYWFFSCQWSKQIHWMWSPLLYLTSLHGKPVFSLFLQYYPHWLVAKKSCTPFLPSCVMLDNSKPRLNWLGTPYEKMTTSETGGQLNQDVAEWFLRKTFAA